MNENLLFGQPYAGSEMNERPKVRQCTSWSALAHASGHSD